MTCMVLHVCTLGLRMGNLLVTPSPVLLFLGLLVTIGFHFPTEEVKLGLRSCYYLYCLGESQKKNFLG